MALAEPQHELRAQLDLEPLCATMGAISTKSFERRGCRGMEPTEVGLMCFSFLLSYLFSIIISMDHSSKRKLLVSNLLFCNLLR